MAERHIDFRPWEVPAILAGRKSQTRRIIKPQPMRGIPELHEPLDGEPYWVVFNGDEIAFRVKVPYAVGDRLWVREAWRIEGAGSRVPAETCRPHRERGRAIEYRADGYEPDPTRERSPIHMPRWASRLTLTVTDVRVQRLQDISEAEAVAEGIERSPHGNGDQWVDYPAGSSSAGWLAPRDSYRSLWNHLHGPGSWDANPWVTAITFSAERRNIDNQGERTCA